MRDWINAIFSFIGTTSLTDVEYNSINFTNITAQVYNQTGYDELSKVLTSRESVSDLQERLVGVFKAKGANVAPAVTARTNILLGIPL